LTADYRPDRVPGNPRRRRRALAAGALFLVLTASGLALAAFHYQHSDPSLASLVAASSPVERTIEPRLSGGFAWAPFHTASRRGASPSELTKAIAKTLSRARGESTPSAQHTTGVAMLLAGNPRDAYSDLAGAAETASSPLIWSDLAAASYATAVQYDAPDLLANALAACDHSLASDPQAPEPLFNRALVIERLGLRDDAREAWEHYLTVDSTSGWALEAREHLRAVQPATPFVDLLDRDYDRLSNNPSAVMALASRDPQSARGYGWMEILGRWGEAVLRGNARDAARHLRIAKALAAAVARINGDQMFARVVAAIDAAGGQALPTLAAAHVDYRAGIKAFQDHRPADAEPLLRRSAVAFERAQSPMALNAAYFAANTTFEQGHHDEAQKQLETLIANAPQEFPAYRAQVSWEIGVCHTSRGDWGEAITLLQQCASTFDQLGEIQNAGAVRRILAYIYDRTGDPAKAWKERMAALRGVGVRSGVPLEKGIASIAAEAILRLDWHTAKSFLSLEIAIAHRMRDDVQLTDALLTRAAVGVRMQDITGAGEDLAEAGAATVRIKEPAYREWGRHSALRMRAALTPSPAEAEALLTQVIAFQSARSDQLDLPNLYLERGVARRRNGDTAGAAEDFRAGIAHLETQRGSLSAGEARWGAFHAAEELFDQAIDLAISQNDAASAFAAAEAGRARALLESYGRSPSADFRTLPADTTIVEYAALPSRLVIFTISRSGVRAVATDCDAKTLAAEVETLSHALRADDTARWKKAATSLHRRLIDPVASQLLGSATIVFVPDAVTATVPFSALLDGRGESLLENHAIVIGPSAAVFAAASEKRRSAQAPRSVLVVSNSQGSTAESQLSFVNAEAGNVARRYRSAVVLREDEAEFGEFANRAAAANAIHFAGHAVGDDSGLEPASILLRGNGRTTRIGVARIATLKLPRTSVVVLAGCGTARGERRAAEGVISVAHGFLTAGAPSVIATLWPIHDEASAALFPRLHQRLAEGMPPAEALRAVQLESIHQGNVPASLWAAIQDIGS
jgi:CHAT domain-containing protein/tetratricopeptide (TPR) repeat protein